MSTTENILTSDLPITNEQKPLRHYVQQALDYYFTSLDGHEPANLYALVLEEVEQPLLEFVLRYTKGNQCKAAAILGISRGTLRKKLQAYNLE